MFLLPIFQTLHVYENFWIWRWNIIHYNIQFIFFNKIINKIFKLYSTSNFNIQQQALFNIHLFTYFSIILQINETSHFIYNSNIIQSLLFPNPISTQIPQ